VALWILDTDHISLFQGNQASVTQRFSLKQSDQIATTIITFEEQVRGWLAVIRRASSRTELVRDYRKLAATRRFLNGMQVLDFSEEAAVQYFDLLSQKLRVGTQDLRIAAIALSVGGIVVTRNRRDFERVPGLQIEDWSIAAGP
jgi:tRNA(fMet)-specific endonuclease VapC